MSFSSLRQKFWLISTSSKWSPARSLPKIDLVNGPVPGPTSRMRRCPSMRAMVLVIAFARIGDDGHTEPVWRKLRMASVMKSSTETPC